mgnify:CR=1 FL=1
MFTVIIRALEIWPGPGLLSTRSVTLILAPCLLSQWRLSRAPSGDSSWTLSLENWFRPGHWALLPGADWGRLFKDYCLDCNQSKFVNYPQHYCEIYYVKAIWKKNANCPIIIFVKILEASYCRFCDSRAKLWGSTRLDFAFSHNFRSEAQKT